MTKQIDFAWTIGLKITPGPGLETMLQFEALTFKTDNLSVGGFAKNKTV